MKNKIWVSLACSLLLVFASLPNNSAFAGTSVMDVEKKLVGDWQVGFHPRLFSPGAKVSFREYFLTGQVGPVWRFKSDGTATAFIPCNINERFKKGDIASGTWQLLEEGKILSLRAHSLVGPNSPMEMRGALEFDMYPSKDIGDGTMSLHESSGSREFGRYDSQIFTCD